MQIPDFLSFKTKYGLLVTDNEVIFMSWRSGHLSKLGAYPNDENGVTQFLEHVSRTESLHQEAFHILVNIIGEDYRFEKVAHLIGKYKTDLHAKRMGQLFRGSQLAASEVQGREERGRREDLVLFAGILTENKVSPWISAVTRGGRYLGGVHMVALVLSDSILRAVNGAGVGQNLILTIHERGLLRQTLYVNGHLRFSRVSKIRDNNAEEVASSIRKELERMLQYLHSLKISVAGGVQVRMISPTSMTSQLREAISSGDRIKFEFYDAAQIARRIGLKTPLESMGHDSSLPLQVMFSGLRLKQLAQTRLVTYYWMQNFAKAAVIAFLLYGINGYITPIGYYFDGLNTEGSLSSLEEERRTLQTRFDAQVSSEGKPPSSSENMKAVSDIYSVLENITVSPTQLLFYVGQGLAKNDNVRIDNLKWQVANEAAPGGESGEDVVINGKDIYQIVTLKGELEASGPSETYRDVAQRADILRDSFDKRADIDVKMLESPPREISTTNLSGSLDSSSNLEAPTTRAFVLQIIWKEYDQSGIAKLVEQS